LTFFVVNRKIILKKYKLNEVLRVKLSTRSRYGLRALVFLAKHSNEAPISVRRISMSEDIPLRYLERIMRILSQKGFVRAEVGAEGGYLLSDSPENIKILDVIEVLEGKLSLVNCIDDPSKCERFKNCFTRPLWEEISGNIRNTLSKYTLADFVKEKEESLN